MILEEGQEPPEWVIGTWVFRFALEFMAVGHVNGKPRVNLGARSNIADWYTWLSYHAARKFQRAHKELEGYIILNLGEARKQAETVRKLREGRLAQDAADLLRDRPLPDR